MATFTIEIRDGEQKGVTEIALTSDPKMGEDAEPTVAQMLGLSAAQFLSHITAGAKREVIDADGRPIVSGPVSF